MLDVGAEKEHRAALGPAKTLKTPTEISRSAGKA
jgi:hypothetical protein